MRRTFTLVGIAAILASGVNFRDALAGGDDEDIWAIRCITLDGADRFELAKKYAEALKDVRGLKSKWVSVFNETGETSVYYGRYKRVYKARTGKESFKPDPLKDLALIRQLSLEVPDPATGAVKPFWPFRLATMETLPVGGGKHPEWELSNARGFYSLQVGVFYNSEKMRRRRFAAEEYCRLLRKEGREAYYHHGAVNSSVCIGGFPKAAIQTWQEQNPYTGIIRVRSTITDERMLALQREFPHNTHNGSIFHEITADPKTGKKVRSPHTSFAVEIPRGDSKAEPYRGFRP